MRPVSTWVLGDVHGCALTLTRLLERLELDEARDRLWLVGDLVNRGPSSLAVLRWARRRSLELGVRLRVVLGNHDLHLLARSAGVAEAKPQDTLDAVLAAPDRAALLDWLLHRPLYHREVLAVAGEPRTIVLVHAGLLPEWTLEEAEREARAAADALRGEERGLVLGRGRVPSSIRKRRSALRSLTRLRMCDPRGRPVDFDGPPEAAPAGLLPWFSHPQRAWAGALPRPLIVFGHWAALGLRLEPAADPAVLGLDGGCVWGGQLAAVRLEDLRLVTVPAADPAPSG